MPKKKNWTKILIKEAKRNPLKAAVLVALAVVASYLWGGRILRPIFAAGESTISTAGMTSMTPTGSADSAVTGIGQTLPTFPGTPNPNSGAEVGSVSPVWIRFEEWLSRQGRQGDESPVFRRDPFERAVEAAVETKPDEDAKQPNGSTEDEPIRPADLGLELRAVIIGPRGRSAVLGDRVVEEGAQITLNKKGLAIPVRIVKISGEGTAIQVGEKEYELTLPPAASFPSN